MSVGTAPTEAVNGVRAYRGPIVSVLSVAGFLLVWFIAAQIAQSRLLPGPVEVLSYVVQESLHGDLLAELGITLWRVLASFVVAMAIGSVIGLAMGFALRLVFTAVEMAGDLIGLQMGLGFAMFYDPGDVQHTPIVGQFMSLLATLTFLAINGHLLVISTLAESFRALPIGHAPLQGGFFQALAQHGAIVFVAGLQLALPLIVTLLVVNLSLGVLTRAAPQLNIFAVGFPVTLAIGFAALVLTLPYFGPLFERTLDEAFRFVIQLR